MILFLIKNKRKMALPLSGYWSFSFSQVSKIKEKLESSKVGWVFEIACGGALN